jgi:hypothetical protein
MEVESLMKKIVLIIGGLLPLANIPGVQAQDKAPPPPAPPVSMTLLDRHGHVTPSRAACSHTGGGNIDVQQPAPDTVIVTMTGAVVADSSMHFDLEQCFEVSFDNPKVKKAKLSIEGRVIGLLRGAKKGGASYGDACASVGVAAESIINVCVPPHGVDGCDNLAINDHAGPLSVPIAAGKYSLQQTFNIAAQGKCALAKKASAEFAPDPALDPLWISYHEPFHGTAKKDFGFQVILKVADDTGGN